MTEAHDTFRVAVPGDETETEGLKHNMARPPQRFSSTSPLSLHAARSLRDSLADSACPSTLTLQQPQEQRYPFRLSPSVCRSSSMCPDNGMAAALCHSGLGFFTCAHQ